MIQNNTITHCCAEPSFWNWEPRSDVLKEFLIAVITTLLAGQVNYLCFDILFGLKSKGRAFVSELGVVLIAQEMSFSSYMAAIFPNTAFSRWRFHPDGSQCEKATRKLRPSRRSICKYHVILVIAFLSSFISNVIVIEADVSTSFDDARFGGIVGGINEDLSVVNSSPFSPGCNLLEMKYGPKDTVLADFVSCSSTSLSSDYTKYENIRIVFQKGRDQILTMNVSSCNLVFYLEHYVKLEFAEKSFRLQQSLTRGQGEKLLSLAAQKLGDAIEVDFENGNEYSRLLEWQIVMTMFYSRFTLEDGKKIVNAVYKKLTVVNADSFQVIDESPDNFEGQENIPLLESATGMQSCSRSTGSAGIRTLLVALTGVTVARFLGALVTHNDTSMGLEFVFKDAVGARCCDSVLQRTEQLNYDSFY